MISSEKKTEKQGNLQKMSRDITGYFSINYKRNPRKNPENIAKTNHLVISDEISAEILYGS